MSPHIYYHTAPRNYRRSILRRGLVAHQPPKLADQPVGVYVYDPHMRNPSQQRLFSIEWGSWAAAALDPLGGADLWRVAYVGPAWADPEVDNAAILPSVTDVTLVTGNKEIGS